MTTPPTEPTDRDALDNVPEQRRITASAGSALPPGYGAPSSASLINPSPEQIEATSKYKPTPMNSITASARRITDLDVTGRTFSTRGGKENWQADAWDMLDLVGEQRFLASTLAGRMGQARMYVGQMPEHPTDETEPVDDDEMQDLLDEIGGGEIGMSQIISRLGVNLFVAGEGWIAGVPSALIPPQHRSNEPDPTYDPNDPTLNLSDLEWRMFSTSEVASKAGGEISLKYGPSSEDEAEIKPSQVYLIRVWRPHPRHSWEADSPTRSSLPVLREMVGLTMHIGAQIDSRLAGAGLLLVPATAAEAVKRAAGLTPEDDDDPFTDALIEAMIAPINDRASASALVPLTVTVPDETIALFRHITFDQPISEVASNLRDESIRRLALGQDAPPELLLGVAGMNHWGAWLVREDVVTTHIEPPLALICDALTTQYLWPMLKSLHPDWDATRVESYVIWYDVSHMIVRPNRSSDAFAAHSAGAISDAALREASGFSETDAPPLDDDTTSMDPAVSAALDLVRSAPTLLVNPGLPQIVAQIRDVMNGTANAIVPAEQPSDTEEVVVEEPATEPESGSENLPDTDQDPAELPSLAASVEEHRSGFTGYYPPIPSISPEKESVR